MRTDKTPQAEVIAIGTELLLGQVVDTNSTYLGRELAETGIDLSHITAVGDNLDRIVAALRFGLARSEVVITTGGLGPTEDDLTREAVATATGQKLVFKNDLMKDIEAFFRVRGLRMTPNNQKQACIPAGALAIRNPVGTAPGFIVENPRWVVISLPGVPRELEHLLGVVVIPYLRRTFRLGRRVILTRVLRVCGLGESGVDRKIGDLIRKSQNPRIGLLASPGDIKISIVSQARSRKDAIRSIDPIEKKIRNRLRTLIYGVDDETLEGKVAGYLSQLKLSLGVADTLTGGLLCQRIVRTGTDRFVQGLVLPSMQGQTAFLGLSSQALSRLIKDYDRYCVTLAQKLLEHADVGLAITGDLEKSNGQLTGTIAICVAQDAEPRSRSWEVGGPLDGMAERASIMALDALRTHLLKRISND